jgi:hypothetical protein
MKEDLPSKIGDIFISCSLFWMQKSISLFFSLFTAQDKERSTQTILFFDLHVFASKIKERSSNSEL